MLVSEEPFFFTRGNSRLFGLWHLPERDRSRTAFLMSHPFGEEKLWSHRVFVSVARALAGRGHAVLRFDYVGAGDSTGTTADVSLSTYLDDIAAALDVMRARELGFERVGLVGLRLGATIATLFAERAATTCPFLKDAPLISWDPIMDGENYFQELLRSNLATQLAVYGKVKESREVMKDRIRSGGTDNVDGYEIGQALFESCARRELLTLEPKKHDGPTLVVQIAATEKQNERSELRALAGAYKRGTFARATEQPFWREIKPFYARALNLQQVTLDWLGQIHD